MADLVTDPSDPRLGRGVDTEPRPQQEAYLVLSEEERAKGFVRPVRLAYRHVGPAAPQFPLVDLTDEQLERYSQFGYVKYEEYPQGEPYRTSATGRFWTQAQLDSVNKGCHNETTMSRPLAETYAREPGFYGATYCVSCQRHIPVSEFVWLDGERVGS